MARPCVWLMGLLCAGCAPGRTAGRERAGTGLSLLPPDRSLEQVFKTDDEAAKAACAWLWKNELKAQEFEYCGFILLEAGGYKATVPMTIHEPTRCPRPTPGPPGETGWYHSHRAGTEFSGPDKSHGFAIATYLCAPNRMVKKLTPEGTVIVR